MKYKTKLVNVKKCFGFNLNCSHLHFCYSNLHVDFIQAHDSFPLLCFTCLHFVYQQANHIIEQHTPLFLTHLCILLHVHCGLLTGCKHIQPNFSNLSIFRVKISESYFNITFIRLHLTLIVENANVKQQHTGFYWDI